MKQNIETDVSLPGQLVPFIWRYLKNRKFYLSVFLLCGLLGAVEMTLSPYLLKVIIDAITHFPENTTLLSAILDLFRN